MDSYYMNLFNHMCRLFFLAKFLAKRLSNNIFKYYFKININNFNIYSI